MIGFFGAGRSDSPSCARRSISMVRQMAVMGVSFDRPAKGSFSSCPSCFAIREAIIMTGTMTISNTLNRLLANQAGICECAIRKEQYANRLRYSLCNSGCIQRARLAEISDEKGIEMNQRFVRGAATVLAVLTFLCVRLAVADWPAYKSDGQRSGVTSDELAFPLAEKWSYETSQPPRPAWPEPGKELHRMDFDYAFQPVVAGGLVCFGSSADDTVRALDLKTGELVWRFIAGGPVRFAPAIAHGRAYVASDDGYLYCLEAKSGELVWRFHAASDDDRVLGNGRVIARHPCRSGALVIDNVVYVTAGMWPTEGVYVYALDAGTGKEIWCNDSSGNIYVDLPHAVANGFSGVAPQGYLVASEHVLLVPTGRSVPAAFDRHTGRLLYYKPEKTHYHGASYGGGVWCTAAEDLYFHTKNRSQNPSEAYIGEAEPSSQDGMIVYPLATGDQLCHLPGKYRVLVSGDVVYAAGDGRIEAIGLNVIRQKRSAGRQDAKWMTSHPARVYCLAMAGGTLLTGNRDSVRAFNAADGKPVWQVNARGQQFRGLAVADGCVVAATQTGSVLCFGPGGADAAKAEPVKETPRPSEVTDELKRTANQILRRADRSEGYAVVVSEPDSRLAETLATRTGLHVVNLLPASPQVAAARERLLDAGLLGSRVAVHSADDPAYLDLPPYFADLIVVSGKVKGVSPEECYRLLRPCGGALCLVGFDDAQGKAFLKKAEIPEEEVVEDGTLVFRGTLPGAGEWRYPWADGGRTGIGKESRVRFPLKLLWFGGSGPGRLVDRHLMGSPPISANGRVFMQGQHHVIAFDAYNGRELWSRQIKNVGRKYAQYYSSSLVADDASVYVVQSDKCHRLDQATGKTLATYTIPASVIRGTAPADVPDYLDVTWPKAWQVIGPFPKGKPPLANKILSTVPQRVTVKGEQYVASELEAVDEVLDFTDLFGGYDLKPAAAGKKRLAHPRRGKTFSYGDVGRICYAFAKINCPKAGKLLVGAGADWGMQWYLDGKPVFDALKRGDTAQRRGYFSREPCSPKDWLFDVDVTAGDHVLAVMVTAGSRGWAMTSANMAGSVKEVMPIATGANPNVPNLKDLVWGYLSATDDLVLGSYNVPITEGQSAESHLIWRSESKAIFALDKEDGTVRWTYRPKPNRVVANIEIAFGDGRLFLIDGTSKATLAGAKRYGKKVDAKLTLVALDLTEGSELWRQEDVPLLGDRSSLSRLKSNITHLFMGLPNWGHLVYAKGVVVLGANAAYDAATGTKLWQKSINPGKLPVVYDDRLLTGSNAFDLRTGEPCMTEDVLTGESVPWQYSRAYGCGPIAGCQNVLFFRSGADGFFDMESEGITNFGGVRPGCARTLLAANGLLLHPQGYSGCGCSYSYKTNLALISAPERDDAWFVFPRRADTGLIKHIAVNFGAPGDRKDRRGNAWLGFPRPMLASACPAPVTVSMKNAACDHRTRRATMIRGTDSPWVYSTALRGQGRIAVDLTLQPNLVMPEHDAAPTIDGNLDDACWKDVDVVPFQNTAFSMLGASIDFRMFRDAENLYFAYHRNPLTTADADADHAALDGAGEFDLFIADRSRRIGIHFTITRDGKAVASFGTVGVSRKLDPNWKGKWQHAVQAGTNQWEAEIALPIETLTESGMAINRLQLNGMSQEVTLSGAEAVFLTDPYYGVKFRCCSRFRSIVSRSGQAPAERTFTVRLHFAETAQVTAGERVFDVLLQGKAVLREFDIFTEAGGPNSAIVKEFTGIRASDQMVVELVPKSSSTAPESQPSLCAIEVFQQLGAESR